MEGVPALHCAAPCHGSPPPSPPGCGSRRPQPLLFIDRELFPLIVAAMRAFAPFVGADPTDIVFIPNATTGCVPLGGLHLSAHPACGHMRGLLSPPPLPAIPDATPHPPSLSCKQL